MARYVTVAQVKLYRGIGVSEQDDDGLLAQLVDRAERQIDRFCGRVFRAPTTAATRYFDAERDTSDDRRTLYLDEDLVVIGTMYNAGALVPSTHYVPEPRNETPYRSIRLNYLADDLWTWQTSPEDAISVTGRWGYSTAAPADVQQATVRLAAYMYAQKDASTFDVTAMPDMGMMTIPQGMPRDVRELLEPYRKLR